MYVLHLLDIRQAILLAIIRRLNRGNKERRKEGNVSFNDAINILLETRIMF